MATIVSGVWLNAGQSRADLVIAHPVYGEIPYTFELNDPTPAVTLEEVQAANIAAFVPPTPAELAAKAAARAARANVATARAEMAVVRDELERIEDGDPRQRGTAQAWRAYRKELRNFLDAPTDTLPVRPA